MKNGFSKMNMLLSLSSLAAAAVITVTLYFATAYISLAEKEDNVSGAPSCIELYPSDAIKSSNCLNERDGSNTALK
jgi:hypothetical protein